MEGIPLMEANETQFSALLPVQPLWWQQGVIYQIYLRSFQDSNGDGSGDLAGVIQRLEYLSEVLGVDALWLTPFYPSPMADGGYDVADYLDIAPLFGDLTTFDRLLAEAHAHGLRVIIDYVPNHSSDQHPWFTESRSSRENARRDWYIWADKRSDGSPPNNWLSMFGGSAWSWDTTREQYYLHSFLSQQPDLNWRHPEVSAAMLEVLRFWLERGVDGFRIDVAHFLMKDPQLRDNPPNPSGSPTFWRSLGPYDSQLHLYDQGHPDVHRIYRDLRQILDHYSHEQPRVSIGELHRPDLVEWAAYYGKRLDELHLPFNFGLLNVPWNASAVRRVVDALEAVVPAGAWPNYVLGNHDEPRIASRVGRAQARIAMMLLLTLRGTPTLYYGDELGMQNTTIAVEDAQDAWEQLLPGRGLGRDPQRTPMPWEKNPNASFCPPGVKPWLPIILDEEQSTVASQRENPCSMLSLTRRLLALRRREPALALGTYHAVEARCEDCFVYTRQHGKQRFVIALNFADSERVLSLPVPRNSQIVLSTFLDREEWVNPTRIRLRGNEGCIFSFFSFTSL